MSKATDLKNKIQDLLNAGERNYTLKVIDNTDDIEDNKDIIYMYLGD